ncbi:NTP transferase domain-containing protein [bacterium]|nr:NTP transferase domain-containing protein [candidate division CSSED10-310 bacterium]
MTLPRRYDGVLLAGTHRNPRRLIHNQNKAFLTIQGEPMVLMVTREMLKCPKLDRVVVVGPRQQLESILESLLIEYPQLKIIQQRSRMLENVWNGFLATFPDGNPLPVNRVIDTLLLGGHFPIKKRVHLYIMKSIFAAVARRMTADKTDSLPPETVIAEMKHRIDEFRKRFERVEWFTRKITINTILAEGHVLSESDSGIRFQNPEQHKYFLEWEERLNKKIFLTACDIPLMEQNAIADFIDRCDKHDDDFFFSVATEEVLKHFYTGRDGSRGIERPYIWLREARIRAANLILVRPNRIGNKELIQESFGLRKMTNWRNMLQMIWKLVRQKYRYQTLRVALSLCAIHVLKKRGFIRPAVWFQKRTRKEQLELSFSRIFRTRFKLIATPFGGISLDVDNQTDYTLLEANYSYWKSIQNEQAVRFNRIDLNQKSSASDISSGPAAQ